jgi:asparaginyl-tRNA synthetase
MSEEDLVAASTTMSALSVSDERVATTDIAAPSIADVVEVDRVAKLSELSKEMIASTKMVQIHGWIYSIRTQGAGTLVFLDINDGSSVAPVRCLAEKKVTASSDGVAETTTKESFLYDDSTSTVQYGYNVKNVLEIIDVTEYKKLTFDELTQTNFCSIGCSVMILGYVTEPPPNTTQPFEIKVRNLYVIGGVADPIRYPIQKSILKKPVALRSYYHARFRAPIIQQIMQIRSQALFAIHEFFHLESVPCLDPNIMTSSDCEGAGEVFKVFPQFFGTNVPMVKEDSMTPPPLTITKASDPSEVKEVALETRSDENVAAVVDAAVCGGSEVGLTVSSQLPLEAMAMGTGAVYTCQKSFRAEKSDTNKHLAEFLHVEYEAYFITLTDLMDQAERYLKHVIRTVLERCKEQYAFLSHRTTGPEEFHGHAEYLGSLLEKPFVRIKHADAVDILLQDARDKVTVMNAQNKPVKLKFKIKPAHGEDLGSEHEKYLVQKFGTFVFVTHWPSAIKSFYMKQVGDGTCESFDLLAPIVGELFGGSMREWRLKELEAMMNSKSMDFTPLQWFVDLRKDGTAPHGGWGMGFDRLVMFLVNANSVRDVVPYPVYYGHCPY